MPVLKFSEKHALTSKFNVNVKLDDSFHEKSVDYIRTCEVAC